MTERRLWVKSLPDQGGSVTLDVASVRHARVLRLRVGGPVRLFDGAGHEAWAEVERIDDGQLVCRASPCDSVATSEPAIVLIQALPKGDKLDAVVRMTTELGVSAIHLATTERTVGRIEGAAVIKRLERLGRIGREAARQSGRAEIPDVLAPVRLSEAAARAPKDAARIVMWEESHEPLPGRIDAPSAWVVVGPEGGLAEPEVSGLCGLGYSHHRMGNPVLRVDTAAAVAVALVRDRMAR